MATNRVRSVAYDNVRSNPRFGIETKRSAQRFGRYETKRGSETNRIGPRLACVVSCFSYGFGLWRSLSESRGTARHAKGQTDAQTTGVVSKKRERASAHVSQGSHRLFNTEGAHGVTPHANRFPEGVRFLLTRAYRRVSASGRINRAERAKPRKLRRI